MRFTGAKTKREAIVHAVSDFNKRQRMARLVRHFGTCGDLMTVEELRALREKG